MDQNLALFLGMLCGDGHLSIHIKKRKYGTYYDYYTGFCNTDERIMKIFDDLFYKIFRVRGHFYPRDRPDRKRIYDFHSYSKNVFNKIVSLGFPIGIKRDKLKIPFCIQNGASEEKINFFKGVFITDGCLRKNGTIIFHSGSKLFLEDLSELIREFIDVKKEVKSYIQREIYTSYQITLNIQESEKILSLMPPSHNGSALVLSLIK